MNSERARNQKRHKRQLVEKRYECIKLHLNNFGVTAISMSCNLSRTTVTKYIKQFKAGKFEPSELNSGGRKEDSGRKLSVKQELEVLNIVINTTPEFFGFPSLIWSRVALRFVINSYFKVLVSSRTAGNYLLRMGVHLKPMHFDLRAKKSIDSNLLANWFQCEYSKHLVAANEKRSSIYWVGRRSLILPTAIPDRLISEGMKKESHMLTRTQFQLIFALSNRSELFFRLFNRKVGDKELIKFLSDFSEMSATSKYLILEEGAVVKTSRFNSWIKDKPENVYVVKMRSFIC